MDMNLNISKKNLWHILLLIILVSSLWSTLSVSATEELVFGDEGYYAARGQATAENLKLSNTPFGHTKLKGEQPMTSEPFTFILLSSFYMIAGEMGMKVLIPIVSVIAALVLFLLVRKMHSTRAGVISAAFYLGMPAIVTHTVFLYTEHISLMFLIGAFYFLYNYLQKEDYIQLIISGILLGFSALTEQTAIIAPLIFAAVLYLYKVDWKGWTREFGTIVLIMLLMLGPWMAHNYRSGSGLGFSSNRILEPMGIDLTEETNYEDKLPDVEAGELPSLSEGGRGTANPLHKFGALNYAEFAYGLPIFILSILGFSFYFMDKKKKYIIPILWAFVLFTAAYVFLSGQRVEGLSRNALYVTAPLAIAAGYASDKIYEYLGNFETTGKMLSVLFVSIIVAWSLFNLSVKAESLRSQKQYSESFFEACDWVKENTPQDSVVHYIYAHRSNYHCHRKSVGNGETGIEGAIMSANEDTHKLYKAVGVDYVMLHSALISRQARRTTYPVDFVQHIMMNPMYESVYQYPQGCNVLNMQQDCVAVYEIKDESEMQQQTGNQTMTISPEDLQGEG